MTGERLKVKLLQIEKNLAGIARKLQMSPQSLNSSLSVADVKTGFIENLARTYNRPISFFFDESAISVDDHSAEADGFGHALSIDNRYSGAKPNDDSKIVELEKEIGYLKNLLAEKERIIKLYESIINK